jgi:hypothetical protein
MRTPIELLRECEWASTVWTDYACCPICGALFEGIGPSKDLKCPGNAPHTHMPDCELKAALDAHKGE